jgi:CDP-diacylglycerol pyrophosphatase
MISEIVLAIVVIVLVAEIIYMQKQTAKETKDLTKAIIAKNLPEITHNEIMEKAPPPTDQPQNEYVALNADDDILFDRHIQAELDAAKAEHDKDELTP